MKTEGKATVVITRRTTGNVEDVVIISIMDEASRANVEARLSLTEFARAVTGCYVDHAYAEWAATERLGTVREVKTIEVPWDYSASHQEPLAAKKAALAPYETDGWRGRIEALDNSHNTVHNKAKCRVGFTRWVKKEAP